MIKMFDMKKLLLLLLAIGFVSEIFGQSIEDYKAKAAQEDAEAQFRLGVCYDDGDGVPMNKSKAVEWYQKAAEQGYAKAQNSITRVKE